MIADPIAVADAVVAELNGLAWPDEVPEDLRFTTTRAYVPIYKLEDLVSALVVVVVPRKETRRRVSRLRRAVLTTVEVGFNQKLPAGDDEAIERCDLLTDLTRLIADYFGDNPRLTHLATACVREPIERDPLYDEELFTKRQFASILRLPIEQETP